MKKFVLDANVILKWFLFENKDEQDVNQSFEILRLITSGQIKIIQPVHWLVEVMAVLIRLRPKITSTSLDALYLMNFDVADSLEIYRVASLLSEEFKHHLFDTLYHAVALCHTNTIFVTADEQYFKKAYRKGCIICLKDFLFN